MMTTSKAGDLLWAPSEARASGSQMASYMRWLNARRQRDQRPPLDSYDALWRFSVDELEAFWGSLWDYFELGPRTFSRVLEHPAMPGARWFSGARLNYTSRLLEQRRDGVAVIHHDETGRRGELTYGELLRRVAGCRAALRELGVVRGDRVVGYVTNGPEALIAFLATASLGAIWSSCPPEFGVESVLDRFTQISPKVLFACAGYVYGGKPFDRRPDVARLHAALQSLEACIWIGAPGDGQGAAHPRSAPAATARHAVRELNFHELPAADEELEPEPVPFDHPLWILFSSGTTGLPKPIVHGHGGMLLEHLKVLALHSDLREGDRFFWFSTTGWMMWNYLVSGLCLGATVVLYDGSPAFPGLDALWKLAAEERVTYFGASAPFLLACKKAELTPGQEHDFEHLRAVGTTGAPLPADGFGWVYAAVKRDLLLASVSGGTDVCTAFVLSCPWLPVHAGEIQCRGLGAKVEAFDAAGESVIDEVGELVLTEPLPSMPVGFWGDADGSRFRESYFSTYPGIWRHGDWIKVTARGSSVIYGRSDSTLNRGGVRMGTSEFYRVVEALPEIADSLVVDTGSLESDAVGKLWLFVVLAPGMELSSELVRRIKDVVRRDLSPRHVPDTIRAVRAIPRTLNGKKLEVPVKRILLGTAPEKAASRDTLADPSALDAFVALARDGA